MQDGGIFIQPWLSMSRNSYFFGVRPFLYVIPNSEFMDINDLRDLVVANAILKSQELS
jgi:CMP-N-acetylneuraminic acid synthetase